MVTKIGGKKKKMHRSENHEIVYHYENLGKKCFKLY